MRISRALIPITIAVMTVTACASPAEQTSTAGEPTSSVVQGTSEASTAPTAESLTTSADPSSEAAETSETTEEAAAELAVDEYGFSQMSGGEYGEPGISYAAVFSNAGSAIATDAQVQITFESEDGTVLSSEQGYLTVVLPGSSVALGGYVYDVEGAETMSVQLLPGGDEALDEDPANFEVTKITTEGDEYGMLTTTATVDSPFTKDLENLEVVAVYRNASGDIIGGDFTYLNFVPAGGSAAVEVTGMGWEGDAPAETEVYVALSGLSLME